MKVCAQHGERHLAEARKQQGLRLPERLVERGVNRLLDGAARRLRPVADGEKRGAAESVVNVEVRTSPPNILDSLTKSQSEVVVSQICVLVVCFICLPIDR